MSSINVPLHRANAETQSMTRRSHQAPGQIMARRLSLPYARLPKLLPKPNMEKPNMEKPKLPNRINGPNGGMINVHRINVVTPAPSTASKATLRPVPGLHKVVNALNATTTNGQPNVTKPKPNVVVLRKSMPPPSTNPLKSMKVAASEVWVPVKRAQISRRPPTLTPAPRGIKLPVKTYSRSTDSWPVISRVQTIASMDQNRTAPTMAKQSTQNATASSPIKNVQSLKTT